MKNRSKSKSKADQIAKLEKAIKKFGDSDGKRTAKLNELRK